jgi:hypothetical protein
VARGSARSKSVMAPRDPLDHHQVREIKAGEGWLVDRSSGGWSLQEGVGYKAAHGFCDYRSVERPAKEAKASSFPPFR